MSGNDHPLLAVLAFIIFMGLLGLSLALPVAVLLRIVAHNSPKTSRLYWVSYYFFWIVSPLVLLVLGVPMIIAPLPALLRFPLLAVALAEIALSGRRLANPTVGMVPLTPPLEGALAVALCGVEFEMRTGADGRSRWRQVLGSHWSHIQPGDTQDRVRQFLGPPDEDLPAATGGDASAIVWKYGKPNEEYQGRVVFSGGTVTRCEPPPPATSRWLPVET